MKQSSVKQNIIQTAAHLFYQNGYNLTGINEIIKEAGIAKATLYNHFKSKNDICIAYLEFKNGELMSDLRVFVNKYEKGNAQILSLFDFLKTFFKSKGFNGCWCINTVSELPHSEENIRAVIKGQKKGLIQFIKNLVEENIETNSKSELEILSKQVYLLYESAISESHLHQDIWPIKSAKGLCEKLIT